MSRTKEQIAEIFLDKFRQINARTGYGLDQAFINQLSYLNPKEQDLIDVAIEHLEGLGYVTTSDSGSWIMTLTQKGFDHIYK